jgi:RNA polymerase sigma-70 factor (ECF subfamily)
VGADLDELERLYRDRFHAFAALATAVVGSPEDGFDVVQDAFVAAVRKRRRFRGDGPLEAWVWRIVLNKARDARRRRAPSAVPTRAVGNGHRRDAEVRLLLARLPARQRETIFLRYYAELDYEAIAGVLGISTGTVGATLHSARAALREQLEVTDA